MQNTKGKRFIFVGGVGRSGTTLLQNILDSHPEIIGGPEFRNIPDIINLRDKLHDSIRQNKTRVFCSYDDVDRYICTLIENLLLPLADKNDCKFLSEKTPRNILVFPALMELFPEAHFIHMIRDPRAVIYSTIQAQAKAKTRGINKYYSNKKLLNFEKVMVDSKKNLCAGFADSRIAPHKILTVMYEQLVTNVKDETRRICKFLGVNWSKNMLYPSRFKHLGEKPMIRTGFYSEKSFNRDPDTISLNKWDVGLTTLEKAMIGNYFNDVGELAQYGYKMSGDNIAQKVLHPIIASFRKIRKMSKIRYSIKIYPKLLN